MTDYLGTRRFCEKCQHGRKKWKSVYCTNENSNFNGLKVNNIVCAPCFSKPEPGEAEGVSRVSDDVIEFEKLTDSEKDILLTWIAQTFKSIKSVNRNHTSYSLKHIFSDATGIYVTNGQFKVAMLRSGFVPANPTHEYWCFRISEKSVPERLILL